MPCMSMRRNGVMPIAPDSTTANRTEVAARRFNWPSGLVFASHLAAYGGRTPDYRAKGTRLD